jgi:hypothetical protein
MTLAWYGHLKFEEWGWFKKAGLLTVILVSWGLALFEYLFQVPANRYGFRANGGVYDLFQLKVMQEVITLVVFAGFSLLFFQDHRLQWNHLLAGCLLITAVYLVFRF